MDIQQKLVIFVKLDEMASDEYGLEYGGESGDLGIISCR